MIDNWSADRQMVFLKLALFVLNLKLLFHFIMVYQFGTLLAAGPQNWGLSIGKWVTKQI